MANKLKPHEIYVLLDGYNSELDTLDDSDDEQVPNELHKMKIFAASTILVDRFSKPPFMDDKVLASIGKGATHEIRNDKNTIALLKWYNSKSVHMASNFIASGNVDYVERWDKKSKKYDTVERPEKKQMDILHFKMRLAGNLINLGRSDNIKRPRGRPTSASTPSPSPPSKKKTAKESKP
ncbi:hypothetical protein AGLY_015491 [Aphis glycines]|uniref:PiggyBac transposable element-derived protein domain-containing protein n=1 Tax=Aphis glycines TaxID=307491 RepID=A0A6G0T0G2_APHGL|nr:hypothetical protein AGLY_015491 [Aphis glycines]